MPINATLFYNAQTSAHQDIEWVYCESGFIKKLGRGSPPTGLGAQVNKIDMQGGFLSPGLIDTHIHLHMLGQQKSQVSLQKCKSAEDILAAVSARRSEFTSSIQGFGWDEVNFTTPKLPSLEALDNVSGNISMLLTKIDGHAGLANSALLKLCQINGNTQIAGGQIIRDVNGQPSGLLTEKAYELAMSKLPPASDSELDQALVQAQRECIRKGITCIHESAATMNLVNSFIRCDREKKLRLFINGALYDDAIDWGLKDGPDAIDTFKTKGARWRAYGIKFFVDGSLGSRTALLHNPYADHPESSGLQILSTEQLAHGLERAITRGFQALVHSIGPKAFQVALNAYQTTLKNLDDHAKSIRFRIEHAEIVIPQDILIAAKVNAVLAIQPKHIITDSRWLEARVGKAVTKCAGTWNSMLKAGLRLCGGSDAPMDELSPFVGIASASHRPQHFPEETISRTEAIKLYTENAAYASHQERIMGSLREGQMANFTLLDRDIYSVSPDKLIQTTVMQTVIAGEVEHSVFF